MVWPLIATIAGVLLFLPMILLGNIGAIKLLFVDWNPILIGLGIIILFAVLRKNK